MTAEPSFAVEQLAGGLRLRLAGRWTSDQANAVEAGATALTGAAGKSPRIVLDLSGVDRLGTLGAWVLDGPVPSLAPPGPRRSCAASAEAQEILLQEIA